MAIYQLSTDRYLLFTVHGLYRRTSIMFLGRLQALTLISLKISFVAFTLCGPQLSQWALVTGVDLLISTKSSFAFRFFLRESFLNFSFMSKLSCCVKPASITLSTQPSTVIYRSSLSSDSTLCGSSDVLPAKSVWVCAWTTVFNRFLASVADSSWTLVQRCAGEEPAFCSCLAGHGRGMAQTSLIRALRHSFAPNRGSILDNTHKKTVQPIDLLYDLCV